MAPVVGPNRRSVQSPASPCIDCDHPTNHETWCCWVGKNF